MNSSDTSAFPYIYSVFSPSLRKPHHTVTRGALLEHKYMHHSTVLTSPSQTPHQQAEVQTLSQSNCVTPQPILSLDHAVTVSGIPPCLSAVLSSLPPTRCLRWWCFPKRLHISLSLHLAHKFSIQLPQRDTLYGKIISVITVSPASNKVLNTW